MLIAIRVFIDPLCTNQILQNKPEPEPETTIGAIGVLRLARPHQGMDISRWKSAESDGEDAAEQKRIDARLQRAKRPRSSNPLRLAPTPVRDLRRAMGGLPDSA